MPGCIHTRSARSHLKTSGGNAVEELMTALGAPWPVPRRGKQSPPALVAEVATEVCPTAPASPLRPEPAEPSDCGAGQMRTESVRSTLSMPLRTARVRELAGPDPSNDPSAPKIPERAAVEAEHAETWALVQAVQDGDAEAFGLLYDRYVSQVFRFIYYRVNDRALAEDFTSETFLRALRRISTINYQGRDIGAWFMTIARNIVFDHTKSARFRLELPTGETVEGEEHASSPEAAVLAHLTNTRLLQAVNELGEEQKECIVLRFLNGLSVAETAAAMGKNDGAIKALQHRAVKRLASMLADELQ